jgi:ABC-type dipeptide/oligopeptide/nickel transport system permease component
MPPFLQFIIRRILTIPVTLLMITMLLYGGFMLTPAEARAQIYLPPGPGGGHAKQSFIDATIRKYKLDQPYLIQYGYWAKSLLSGQWGYSPTLNQDVLPALLLRTPTTLELALWSLILFIPLGLASGLVAGWKPGSLFDGLFRSLAFFSTSMPSFILSLMMISIFYATLYWFMPGRLSMNYNLEMLNGTFKPITGMLSIDSLLNGRPDIFIDVIRHLAMPVITLSMFHWATLGRITRTTVRDHRNKEYIVSARARGVSDRRLVWRHILRSILAPSLTGIALSATSIVSGVFVIETIFNLPGVSQVVMASMTSEPDAPAALGFAVYSVILVILLMFLLDVIQALVDPRVREETLKS